MKRFIKSFFYALNGWKLFFRTEQNGQIQAVAMVLAIIAGFVLHINIYEWIIILICIALVLALEMTNSVVEKLVDHLHPDIHDNIKWIKDVAAGSVLWAAFISAIIAGIIFIPKILLLF